MVYSGKEVDRCMRKVIGILIIIADVIFTFFMYYTSKKNISDFLCDSLDILPITVALLLFALVLIFIK